MLPKDRLKELLRGGTPDYVPLFPKISYASSQFSSGISLLDYMTNPHAMAQSLIESARRFGYDAVGVVTDIANEGMALGSRYMRTNTEPSKLAEHLLHSVDEYSKIPVLDPREAEPTRTILLATEELRRQAGETLFITAWCNGPLNVASQLLPLDELLCSMLDEPETLHALLQKCTDFSVRYAQALVRAGADGVAFGHATASCTMISPASYREFAFPYETQIVNAIHAAGGVAIAHICGNILPIAEQVAQNGADIIDCDHMCDIGEMLAKTGKVIRGNVDPALLARGTPQQVYDAAATVLSAGKASKRLILGTGCEVNLGTPAENLAAMDAARKDLGKYDN